MTNALAAAPTPAPLDSDARYRAFRARDPRFDGTFFVGVSSTGIYCRPVCPAPRPRRENCSFFETAAGAEEAGYRPCLRCRPERAPGRSPADAVGRLAAAAVERIGAGALNGGSVADLAASLCVGERQLRRALKQELGVSPVSLAQTRRLLLAKQLLMETTLPVTRVAYAAGFSSVSRFNALFRQRYRLSPSELRRAGDGDPARATRPGGATLRLDYRPPLNWPALLGFLGARATPGVERVAGRTYARTVALGGVAGWVEVGPARRGSASLAVRVSESLTPVLMPLLARLRRLFDLDADPGAIAAGLGGDSGLGSLVAARPGLRVPGALDGFELAVRAVLGQQVSVAAATTLAGRLAGTFGDPSPFQHPGLERLPVTAERLAAADPSDVARVGLPESRARTLVALARAVDSGDLDLAPGADAETVRARLLDLPGIGPWTADYIAMRALHWPDAFPAGDLGIRKAIAAFGSGGATGPGGGTPVTLTEATAAAEAWRPWRAYAAMHLWESLNTDRSEDT